MRYICAALVLAALAISVGNAIAAADAPQPPLTPLVPQPAPVPVEKLEKWEPTPAWLIAIERLRITPKPGAVEQPGLTAGVTEIFELSKTEKENVEKIVADFDAELLKKAAKWEGEMKAARAEYEAKVIAALPEVRRDAAKKLLDFSHAKWAPPLERELKFRDEFVEREKALREKTKGKTPEEIADAREELKSWVKEARTAINKEDEDTINALKALLSADEAQRLDKYNRHRVVPVAPVAPPPKK